MNSTWRKYLSQPGNIRVVALEATELMHELCLQQGLQGPAQKGYAEAVMGALLIASAHKSNESINLNAQGRGRWRQAIVDASPEGRVRGFLNEDTDVPDKGPDGNWGAGVLSVLYTKNFEGKTPYTGMVAISHGHLDQSINEYYRDSEQLQSLIGLSIEWNDRGGLLFARGALIQALGGATPEELKAVAALNVRGMRELASTADNPQVFTDWASRDLGGRKLAEIEATPLQSFCTCSQERIERALLLTGEADTLEALADDEFMTITCDFCRREYRLAAERVRALFKRDPSHLQ